MGGETAEPPMIKASAQEETARESCVIATDAPAASNSYSVICVTRLCGC
jgi:hypothetical protein